MNAAPATLRRLTAALRADSVADAAALVADGLASWGTVSIWLQGDILHHLAGTGTPPADDDGWVHRTTSAADGDLHVALRHPDSAELGELVDNAVAVLASVTDRFQAIRGAESARRLVEAAPDAILVVAGDGRILQANPEATDLFGYPTTELLRMRVEQLLPEDVRPRHAEHRHAFAAAPRSRAMAAGQDLFARRADGTQIAVDIGLAPITSPSGRPVVAAFVRDASDRRRVEQQRRLLVSTQERRRQALELNDNIVQGLVSVVWALQDSAPDVAEQVASETLDGARQMLDDLIAQPDHRFRPGDLVRRSPAGGHGTNVASPPATATAGQIRIVIADDARDVRLLLRHRLSEEEDLAIVGEAVDGQDAVEQCQRHRPDVVVLDVSMPRLDGLQAAERIRELCPEIRIVMLSGYPSETMRTQALAAGACDYIEKSPRFEELKTAIHRAAAPV